MTLDELQELLKTSVLLMRAMQRLTESACFAAAWERADDAARERASVLLREGDKFGVMAWMEARNVPDFSDQSVRALRKIAHGIPYASHMSKAELLSAIAGRKAIVQGVPRK